MYDPIERVVCCIRRIAPDGFGGDGGPATSAALANPTGVAVGADGSLYVADFGNHRVRRVSPDETITTVAGSTTPDTGGNTGDGGPATAATFRFPVAVAVGPDASVYVADRDNHRIRRIAPSLPGVAVGNLLVPSQDGRRLYLFNGLGKHQQTVDALTRAVLYTFGYDSAGRLASITDAFDNQTSIQPSQSGDAIDIVGPYGQTTGLGLDGNGFVASLTNPAGETTNMGYTPDGLLTSFTNARGESTTLGYSPDGRLVSHQDAVEAIKTLTRTDLTDGWRVDLAIPGSGTTRYQVRNLLDGTQQRDNTFANGLSSSQTIGTDGVTTTTLPDGTSVTETDVNDPRFGMAAPVVSSAERLPSGLTRTTSATRAVVLSNPADPLSIVSQTEQTNVNNKVSLASFSASSKTWTYQSPQGRQTFQTLNSSGQVAQVQVGNLAPTAYGYDSRGRLSTLTVGTGDSARVTTFGYDDLGRLQTVTDPLTRTQSYSYDDANRVATQTFSDGNSVVFGYDANGNVTSVTPPGRPAHAFGFTPNDLMSSYTPPAVEGTGATTYEYNLDKQPTVIHRPDGSTINFTYDSAGTLWTTTYPKGPEASDGNITVTRTYNPTTGKLASAATSDGQTITYGYDGNLLTSTMWSGAVAGTVSRTYNNDFRVASRTAAGSTVPFG